MEETAEITITTITIGTTTTTAGRNKQTMVVMKVLKTTAENVFT